MIHLSDTLQIDRQKTFELKKFALPVEVLLLLLFLFCSACGTSPGQPSAALKAQHSTSNNDANSYESNAASNSDQEPSNCGRHNYPVYQDVENQKVVNSDIESGSAQVILHFHVLGQATLDAFLARTPGVLEVESQWPDWGAISITVNEAGLRALSEDCAVRVIEANKREYPQ